MKDRIRRLMDSQHMTQQSFADFLGISPATLSSIFNERTRPTLALVEAIKKRIKGVNTDWLVLGEGPMFLDGGNGESSDMAAPSHQNGPKEVIEGDIFGSVQPAQPVASGSSVPSQHADEGGMYAPRPSVQSRSARQSQPQGLMIEAPQPMHQRQITEIRVFYSDQTWETFVPKK